MKNGILTKTITFSLIFMMLVEVVSAIFIPKWTYNVSTGDATGYVDKYSGYYNEPKDTIDVLFLGVSTGLDSFLPVELYKEYGVTSFVLSCGSQRLPTTYYLLRDTYDYQHPKYIILDVSSLLAGEINEVSETDISMNYKASMQIRGISNKIHALLTLKRDEDSVLDLYVPLIKFHERWEELKKADFQFSNFIEKYPIYFKGSFINTSSAMYWGLKNSQAEVNITKTNDFKDNWNSDNADSLLIKNNLPNEVSEESKMYFGLIYQFCLEKGINLICLKGPSATNWSLAKHDAVVRYLNKYQLDFMDYNFGDYKLDIDWNKDTADHGYHVNYYGAVKSTHAIGEYLRNDSELADHRGDAAYTEWDKAVEEYEEVLWDRLSSGDDKSYRYLETLKENLNDEQVVLIAVMDDVTDGWDEEYDSYLKDIGLEANLYENYRCSYIAVIENNSPIFEKSGDQLLVYRDAIYDINGEAHKVELTSAGMGQGNYCNIKIDNVEYALRKKGLNIVLYNKSTCTVESSVAIDTFGDGYYYEKIYENDK